METAFLTESESFYWLTATLVLLKTLFLLDGDTLKSYNLKAICLTSVKSTTKAHYGFYQL